VLDLPVLSSVRSDSLAGTTDFDYFALDAEATRAPLNARWMNSLKAFAGWSNSPPLKS
jgi:hypothetical protein